MAVSTDGGATSDTPDWDSLKPAAATDTVAETPSPDWDSLKPASAPPKESSGIFRRAVADPLVTAAKSVVSTGQAAVGLADIPTLGKAGKALESIGADFPRTQQILEEAYSPEQQEANRRVRDAQGFTDTLGRYAENPSVIAHDIGQSVGPMLLGQGIGGAAMKAAPAISRGVAGAIGEGAVTAGSSEEQIREQTPGGETSLGQTALAAGSGALTGAITGGSNRLANQLGIGDVNTLFIPGAEDVAKQGIANKAKAIGTEAALEAGQETVQSGQEQAATNLATGKDVTEGLGNAMAAGAVTGGGMGLGGGILSQAGRAPVAPPPAPEVAPVAEEQPKTNFEAVTENLKAQVGPVKGIATKVASMAVDAGITPEQQAAQVADTQPVNPVDGLPETPSEIGSGPQENTDLNQEPTEQSVTPTLDPAAASMARNALNTVQASLDKGGVMGTVPPVLRNAAKAVGVYDPTMAPDQLLETVAQRLAENDTAPAEQPIENDFDFDESIPFDFAERTPRPTAADRDIARDAAAHDAYHAEDEQDEDAYLEREREIRRQEAAQQAPAPVVETPAPVAEAPVPAPVAETPAPQAEDTTEYKPQTLKEFEATNPDLKGSRVRNRWAGSVHDAWNAGVAVPESVIEELKAVAPNFLPDAIATDEVLLDRLQPKITNNLENEIDRVTDAKAKKAKEIDRKIKKQKLGMTESLTVLKDDYAELYRLKDTLDSLTTELHGRKTQNKNDGPYARDIVGKYRQYKLAEHQSKNQQQEPENGESENTTEETASAEEKVNGKEKYIPTNSIVEAAAVTEAAKRGLSDEQIKAGDYQRGFTKFDGLDIAIENGAGTTRSGVSEDGKRWSQQMKSHYGEIGVRDENGNLKTGADGDLVDVFVNPQSKDTPGATRMYFVIDQINPKTGAFDEHKVMAGYPTIAAARKAYLENYEPGWKGLGAITPMKMADFKAWLQTEDATKPVSDKVGAPAENVKPDEANGKEEGIGLEQKIANAQYRAQGFPPKTTDVNIYTPDAESEITGKGKHNRLLVFKDPQKGTIDIREDYQSLPMSTEQDRIKVANGYQRMHGKGSRLTLVDVFDEEGSVWYVYKIDSKEKALSDAAPTENVKQTEDNGKGPQFSRPDEMTSIFEKLLPESSTTEKQQARQAMAAHPEAARMQYVEDHFYDLLLELDKNGKVTIKC